MPISPLHFKRLFFVYLAFMVARADAATIAWGVLEGGGTASGDSWDVSFLPKNGNPLEVSPGWFVYPNLVSSATKDGTRVSLSGNPDGIVLAYGDSWVRLEEGDLVDASSTRNRSSYFLHGWLDGSGPSIDGYDVRADDPIEAPYSSAFTFYLGFATGAENDTAPDMTDNWSHVYYGWARFVYARGTISLVNSALNTEGGGIYVGTDRTTAVPEPASGALALLGALPLLRRRRAVR